MHIEDTIRGLLRNPQKTTRARELGQLAFRQWLDGLPGDAPYDEEAICAYLAVMDLERAEPSVAIFCDLVRASLSRPLRPLDLALPSRRRQGGSRARRRHD